VRLLVTQTPMQLQTQALAAVGPVITVILAVTAVLVLL